MVCRSACAPATSHYGVTGGPVPSLRIRAACEIKKPVPILEAVAAPVAETKNEFIVNGSTVATPGARRMLRA